MLRTVSTEASRTARVLVFGVDDGCFGTVWGMPGASVEAGCAALQLPPACLAEYPCAAVGVAGVPMAPVTELPSVVADGTRRGTIPSPGVS